MTDSPSSLPPRQPSYFALLQAFGTPGCAMCEIVSEAVRHYLRRLPYQCINDPAFRARWRASQGFCRRHSWLLTESGDGLGLGSLYLDLIENFPAHLVSVPCGQGCEACDIEDQSLHKHLDILAAYWPEADLRLVIEKSDGLCTPHLRTMSRHIHTQEIKGCLTRLTTQRLQRLGAELRRLTDNFDDGDGPPNEVRARLAWRQVVEVLNGNRDFSEDRV